MQDTFRHQGLRKRLIEELKALNIADENVLNAILKVPRHLFMDTSFNDTAYENKPFPIEKGQTISNPYTVAFQTELLNIQPSDKILEIGTGSGYQAAILSVLCNSVYSIERHKILSNNAEKILLKLGFSNVQCFYGDGFLGLPDFAPFDKIIITAAAPEIPNLLLNQLKIGGYLVLPFGNGDTQEMLRIKRINNTKFEKETFEKFTFVPMLKGIE